jgi:undecaprenyl-diphosphatase
VGFYSLSRAVVDGQTEGFDRQLLLAMRETNDLADPVGPRWLEEVGRDITAVGGVAVLSGVTVLAVAFLWLASIRHAALYVALACGGAMIVSSSLKQFYDRPRPDLVPHGAHVYTASFPSGHSTMAATVYLTLGMLASRYVPRRRLKALFIGTAILVTASVGVSRVYLGVHWPTDVLAGWSIGTAWALLCWCVAIWLQDEGVIEQEDAAMAKEEP